MAQYTSRFKIADRAPKRPLADREGTVNIIVRLRGKGAQGNRMHSITVKDARVSDVAAAIRAALEAEAPEPATPQPTTDTLKSLLDSRTPRNR